MNTTRKSNIREMDADELMAAYLELDAVQDLTHEQRAEMAQIARNFKQITGEEIAPAPTLTP